MKRQFDELKAPRAVAAAPEQHGQRRRMEARSMLMAEFGIDSVFVGVPKLARILGMASSTIYSYIRQGRFFIPYRLVNKTPMVRLDDLVDWYSSSNPGLPVSHLPAFAAPPQHAPFAPAGDLSAEALAEVLGRSRAERAKPIAPRV
jgi:predicted DNA-binding transcriptional regulator AlpA